MEKGVKKSSANLAKTNFSERNLIIFIILVIIILIAVFGYFLLFYYKICNDEICFFNAIDRCKKVSWIREDSQASWQYKITGIYGKTDCNIKVKLLKIKQGTIDIEKLQRREMKCIINKGSREYPEKTLLFCNGLLKEGMQEIIIQRMHNYILQNLGEIKQGFSGI
ncbi:MAG: hypothetical protein AABX54_00850 [Nanoarchaeota archaeon]